MRRSFALLALSLTVLPHAALSQRTAGDVLRLAMERAGGAPALERVERAHIEQMTLWHRQTFEDRPFGDQVGSYERVTDQRDYTIPAWRNTRRFVGGGAAAGVEIIDLVRDTIAARFSPQGPNAPAAWGPLNIAYVDERRELFTFSPERLLPLAMRDPKLALLPDTLIDAGLHHRVKATIERFPVTLFVHAGTGLLARARFRAAQPRDFGLAPFGNMEVDIWYSQWRPVPGPGGQQLRYPGQIDIARLGRPYKRLTILSARFDAAAAPDSFTIADDVRARYRDAATRPMWEIPVDSGRITEGKFAVLGTPGFAPQAVKVGSQWLLLEGSAVPERAPVEEAWLRARDGAGFGGVLISTSTPPRGGMAWFVRNRRPVLHGRGAARAAAVVLANWDVSERTTAVSRGQWVKLGGDSLWVEPFDAPGSLGGLLAYVPSLRWAYHALALDPLVKTLIMERVKERGWTVERLGHARALTTPVTPAPRAGAGR
jgi:hypothetical protein